jgi:hypothetical protein
MAQAHDCGAGCERNACFCSRAKLIKVRAWGANNKDRLRIYSQRCRAKKKLARLAQVERINQEY